MLAPSKPPSYRHQRHGTRTHARGHQESKSIKHACIETVATKTTRERPHASKKLHISAISTTKPHMKPFNHNIGHTPPTKHPQSQMVVRTHHQAPPNTTQHPQAQRSLEPHEMEHASPKQTTIVPTPTAWDTNTRTRTSRVEEHQTCMYRDRSNQDHTRTTTCKQEAPHQRHKHN